MRRERAAALTQRMGLWGLSSSTTAMGVGGAVIHSGWLRSRICSGRAGTSTQAWRSTDDLLVSPAGGPAAVLQDAHVTEDTSSLDPATRVGAERDTGTQGRGIVPLVGQTDESGAVGAREPLEP